MVTRRDVVAGAACAAAGAALGGPVLAGNLEIRPVTVDDPAAWTFTPPPEPQGWNQVRAEARQAFLNFPVISATYDHYNTPEGLRAIAATVEFGSGERITLNTETELRVLSYHIQRQMQAFTPV